MELQNAFNNSTLSTFGSGEVSVLKTEIDGLIGAIPGLIPAFTVQLQSGGGSYYYRRLEILAYLGVVIGKLKVAIDTSSSIPVTERREFSFISDKTLREILERDYEEIQRDFIAKSWKSVIILSGGAIEAILLDLLSKNKSTALASQKAPKKSDLTAWELANLIEVAVDLGLINPSAEKLSHSVREYRNLVHPGNEMRNHLSFGAEEAKIALEVLHIIHRDLSK
ncbi:MAG: hypothetical protein L0Y74_07750 [candidate division Zixibacteria bacterium]|nr:hypothetical protein [candidate division Zixibacteria bacterium]